MEIKPAWHYPGLFGPYMSVGEIYGKGMKGGVYDHPGVQMINAGQIKHRPPCRFCF